MGFVQDAGMEGMQYNWYFNKRGKKGNKNERAQKREVVRTLLV
jgi:hypothetical protein